MILIHKGKEPASLTAYRKEKFSYYDGCNKNDIRDSLLEEQGYLCAYCMRRIDKESTRIEHWKPENLLSEQERMDYSNMLAVCYKFSEGLPKEQQTCDARKGKTPIFVDPKVDAHINSIGYKKGTGIIFSEKSEIDEDLNLRLNLNCDFQNLPANRKAALQRVIRELEKRKRQGNWKLADINRVIDYYEKTDAKGHKPEYAGIILWYLKKKR